MFCKSDVELKPRNGHTLRVGIVCRISGCTNQKELSLDDQEDNAKAAIAELYDGAVEFRIIATKGKGERIDRPEIEQIEAAYKSGEFDVFVFDDLSRLVRGGEAARLLAIGVVHRTRSICINDGIDTTSDTWEEDALTSCSENVAHNQRTSKRIKQKLMNRFRKFGGAMARPIYGYVIPDGAKTYGEWQKDPAAERHILEGARILRATLNGAAVADYFNNNGVSVGPYAQTDRWNGTSVLRFYRNPLLKGFPCRGRMHSVKNYETGRRESKRNPGGPVFFECPHLAYFEVAEFDDLVATLARHNKHFRRKPVGGVDPRANVPRKRTRFPGQHARCWYCGRTYNWGGNGIVDHLTCSGSAGYECWNSIHIDGALVVDRIMNVVTTTLYDLEGFDNQFRQLVEAACRDGNGSHDAQLKELSAAERQQVGEKDNLLAAILELGLRPMFTEKLAELESNERDLARRRYLLERAAQQPLQLPESIGELRSLLEAQLQPLSRESPEFGSLLRQIVPEFHVYLVRLLDGGHPLPRARIKLALGGMVADVPRVDALESMLTRVVTVDLFEPPQRERIRTECVRLESAGFQQRQIAAEIPEHPTQAAVFKALALHRRMLDQGLDSPYVMQTDPPLDYPKLRRHRNRNYRFSPWQGHLPPSL